MKSIDKLKWLTGLESQTEGFIDFVVKNFQNLDEQKLQALSPTGGWSIVQCLEHLNTYGDYYLPKLQAAVETGAGSLRNVYTQSWLGGYLIRPADPTAGTRKYKAAKRHQPATNLLAHQVVADFIDQQETMLCLLRTAQHADLNRVKIPLSIASWLRLPTGDLLHFMVAHTQRHMMQAERNM